MKKLCQLADEDVKRVKTTIAVLIVGITLCGVLLVLTAGWMAVPTVYARPANLGPIVFLAGFLAFAVFSLIRQLQMLLHEASTIEVDDSSIIVTFAKGGSVRIDRRKYLRSKRTRLLSIADKHGVLHAIWFRADGDAFLVSDRGGNLSSVEDALRST